MKNKSFGFEACSRCWGAGQRYGEECRVCYGKGKVVVKQPPKRCAACQGTGYVCEVGEGAYNGICTDCSGSGWQHTIYPVRA